jgi:hypothetical protein
MTIRTVLGTSVLVTMCAACASNKPATYLPTKGMTPNEKRDMYSAAYERQLLSHEKALAEQERLWKAEEN